MTTARPSNWIRGAEGLVSVLPVGDGLPSAVEPTSIPPDARPSDGVFQVADDEVELVAGEEAVIEVMLVDPRDSGRAHALLTVRSE